MKSLFKKKRFWIGLSSVAAGVVYLLDGQYVEAIKSVVAGLAG